ncbi:hypothetical protein [Nitrincola sp. A-D6]|uniref:hypothetical protein n=1 Tax=Nitrincola sp. A-D6 TaxID=1545442 RepID=UPI001362C6B6|nr:hypothetical protein [Nitrincola sp. A-D6]
MERLFSTGEDLVKFGRITLQRIREANSATHDWFTDIHSKLGGSVWHDGTASGFTGHLQVFPDAEGLHGTA